MVIIQKSDHFLRWYGMVTGLIVFGVTVWVMHEFFDLARLGIILGGILFFLVWTALVVIHFPFAVRFGVDPDREKILVGSQEFSFNDVLSVEIRTRPVKSPGEGLEVDHELCIEGYANPILIHPARAKPRMNRAQLQAYERLLSQADFGPRNPVIRREHHRESQRYGTNAGQKHPLEDEITRAKALAQLRELLADSEFDGGLSAPGLDNPDDQHALGLVHEDYRAEFPELFHHEPHQQATTTAQPSSPAATRPAHESELEHHRSVVQDLGSQIQQRTAGLGRGRRVLAWTLGVALLLMLLTVIVSMAEVLPTTYEDAVNATMIITLLVTLIAAVVHSVLFDLHIRAIRREGGRLISSGSTAAQSIAALAQQWWVLHEEDKNPEWSTTAQHSDPRNAEWNPEELVLDSGALPGVLSHAWFQNPRRTLAVVAIILGLMAMFLLFMGIDTQNWAWYIGTGILALAAIGTVIRADRNKAHRRQDLKEFAHRVEHIRRTNGLQA